MQNRRQNYRHTFRPDERIAVFIETKERRSRHVGEMLNLSIDGLLLRLNVRTAALRKHDRVTVSFQLPGEVVPFKVPSQLIHANEDDGSHDVGVQFLPSASSMAHEMRENMLWRFLMREQRRSVNRDRSAEKGQLTLAGVSISDED